MNLALRDDDPDYPALTLGNYMLGGGFLNSRLLARIRGKDGLSYGVGSQLPATISTRPASSRIAIYAPREPREAAAGVQRRDCARAHRRLHRGGNRRRPSPAGCRGAAWRARRTTNSSARSRTTCSSAARSPGMRSSRRKCRRSMPRRFARLMASSRAREVHRREGRRLRGAGEADRRPRPSNRPVTGPAIQGRSKIC